MAKKFYAVKKGYTIGVFSSWEECKQSINGFSGSEYKAFPSAEEAQAFIDGIDYSKKHIEQAKTESTVIAYVDGSFDPDARKYSYGCILLSPDGEEVKEYNCGNKDEALPSKNIAGELAGAMYAITWTVSHGYDSIIIKYNYEGLSNWFTGEWKANSYVAIEYVEFLKKYRDLLRISFEKVPAHSGDAYNEEADRLAKNGLKLTTKREIKSGASWFTVQGITIEDITTIFEILAEEINGLNIKRSEDANGTIFYVTRGKDRLKVKIFSSTGKTSIQGRPRVIFHSFVSYITQLLEIDEITPILNKCYEVDIKKGQVEDQYMMYLPNVPNSINSKLKNSLLQSIYNLNYTGAMFDFTYLVHPVLRVLEGHLKMILMLYGIPLDKDRISCFVPIDGNFELKSEYHSVLPDRNILGYLNESYNFFNNNRHGLFHWDTAIGDEDTTRIIDNKHDVDILIKEALSIVNKFYVLQEN